MALQGKQTINIGLPDQQEGSDNLYVAFNKIKDNFDIVFACASSSTTFVAGEGIQIDEDSGNATITISNTNGLFDQSLNTTDSPAFVALNVAQINGTNPGNELVIQANNYNFTFNTDGGLTFPDSSIQNTAWPGYLTILDYDQEVTNRVEVTSANVRVRLNTQLNGDLQLDWQFQKNTGVFSLPQSQSYQDPYVAKINSAYSIKLTAGSQEFVLGDTGVVALPNDTLFYKPGSDFNISTTVTYPDPSPTIWVIANEGTSDTPVFFVSWTTLSEFGPNFEFWLSPTHPGQLSVKGPGISDGDTFVPVITSQTVGDSATDGVYFTIGSGDVFTNGEIYTFQFIEEVYDESTIKNWKFDTAGDLTVPGFIHLEYSGVVQGSIGTGPTGFSLVGEDDKDFSIQLAPAGSPPVDWTFSTNGGLTFPDGTTQSTAYVTSIAEPLFVVINASGETAWSNDGTSWSQTGQLSFPGLPTLYVDRVAVADNYIIYTANDNNGSPTSLYYATTYGANPTLVTIPTTGTEFYTWYDVQHGGNYTIAVGAFFGDDGAGGNDPSVPVWAYTTNGSTWTLGDTDPAYQGFYPGSSFFSVDYGANGWFIVAEGSNPGGGAGGFFLTSITDQLSETNYVNFGTSLEGYFPSIRSVVWDGTQWWVKDDNTTNYYVSSGSNPLTSTWTSVDLNAYTVDQGFGLTAGNFYEDAGGIIGSTSWFAVASGDGQIMASNDGGITWYGSVPLPYTGTLASATSGSPCSVTFNGINPNADGTPIVISNAVPSDYNGTYYAVDAGEGSWNLYTDIELATPLDSTFFGALVSADVTFNYGTYIDSLGFGLEKFLVGNDDDQLFTSTDLSTWTKVDDQGNNFAFWNDISFNANWGAGGSLINSLDNGVYSLTLDQSGTTTMPGAVVVPTTYPQDGAFPVGAATAIVVTNGPNTNWTNQGVYANGISFGFIVDGSGNATVTIAPGDGGTGHAVGDTFTVEGNLLGGTTPADDANFQITATDYYSARTILDLTKQVQVLTAFYNDGTYFLDDGTEGQLMYFTWVTNGVYVLVGNARIRNASTGAVEVITDYSWQVDFWNDSQEPRTIAMAIFVDGAWNLLGGATD